MELIVNWFAGTALSGYVTTHPWVWPAAEILHFAGLSLLIGAIGLLDLRMLGFAQGLPLPAVHRLAPWGVLGFAVLATTGVVFIAGDPGRFLLSAAFQFKMLLILLAGVNAIAFYVVAFRKVEALGTGEAPPSSAKIIATSSLVLWSAVMVLGRFMAFV